VETPKRFEEREVYRRFRFRIIRNVGSRCELCGIKMPLKLVYKKDRSIFSELALVPENVSVVCQKCLSGAWPGSSFDGFRSFYDRPEWKRMRERVITTHGTFCRHCNREPDNPSDIHIDHIKPRSIYPELSFSFGNLQPLCADCNLGKGATDFESTVGGSLIDQYLTRIRARAKTTEHRYLIGIRNHISNGPEIDSLIRYIDFRHAVREYYSRPDSLERLLNSVEGDIKTLETPMGMNFDLFAATP
jgi:hypothetical protein